MSGFGWNDVGRTGAQIAGTAGGILIGQPALGVAAGNMAGNALFSDDQKHGMAVAPQQGAAAHPALGILQALQQQMQAEEQRRQQAIMALLQQYSQPQPTLGATQMESRL